MKEEYSFTLTVPLDDVANVEELLGKTMERYPQMRISRKGDRKEFARFYLSFPLTSSRYDLKFQEWYEGWKKDSWDLFGPTYGRWGFK